MGVLARAILYFDRPCFVACDARCEKAWGINGRPSVEMGSDPDDFAYLADGELGEAPVDPGTYEGADGKPSCPENRLNKWCVRECERSVVTGDKGPTLIDLPDLTRRQFNQPWKHTPSPAPETER